MFTVVVISVVVTVVVTVFMNLCCAEVVVAFWVMFDFVKLGKTNTLLLVDSGDAVIVPFEPLPPPAVPFPLPPLPPPLDMLPVPLGPAPERVDDTAPAPEPVSGPPEANVLEPEADILPMLIEEDKPLGTGTLPFVPGSPPPATPVNRIAACAYPICSRAKALLLRRQFGLTPSV